jgi:integrase
MARKTTPGVVYRHSRDCADHERCGKRCNDSGKPWEAWVYDAKYVDPVTGKRGKKIRERFRDHAAAKGWRADAVVQVHQKKMRAVDRATARKTLSEEISDWIAGAAAGEIRNKRDQRYKPAVIRNYELALRLRVEPALGDRRLADITLVDLLKLKEQLQGSGVSDSTVRNTFVPLQAIYRRARRNGAVPINPTIDLGLPTAGVRDRAVTPQAAVELLEPLAQLERALWGTALYAGLRRGELRGLRRRDVDLEAGTITVARGWDDKAGPIEPKSRAGTRSVFVIDPLRPLLEPLADSIEDADALFFGLNATTPFEPKNVARKASAAWKAANARRTEEAAETEEGPVLLEPITLHECRHSFSTFLDHAGVSAARADRYMGHSDGSVAGRYRHQLPTQLAEDAKIVDAYLAGATAGKIVPLSAAGHRRSAVAS